MSKDTWSAVERYLSDLLVRPDDAIEKALRDSQAAGLPHIEVSPNFGKFLMMLAQILGARSILEIGTLAGYSTIWLARGLAPGGRLVTLESDPKHAKIAQANIARAGLSDVVELRLGTALDSLQKLDKEGRGPFDLIFIDADKANNSDYFRWSLKLSRPGSLIIVDNVVRDGAVTDPNSTDKSVQGVRRCNELMAAEPRVCVTAIQTVGDKGYDGFAIARVV